MQTPGPRANDSGTEVPSSPVCMFPCFPLLNRKRLQSYATEATKKHGHAISGRRGAECPAGRKAEGICSQLGPGNATQVGPGNHTGIYILHRFQGRIPSSSKALPTSVGRGVIQLLQGGIKFPDEEGCGVTHTSVRKPTVFLLQRFPSAKNRWLTEAGNQLKSIKRVYSTTPIQDGGHPRASQNIKTQRLVCKGGSEGCVLHYPYCKRPEEVREVHRTVDGQLFQFNCLPFGLSCAPWVLTKTLKPVAALLRELGV